MARLPEGPDDGVGPRSCVGRLDELERVQRAVADLAAGRGGVLLVEGVAGIGKTFLLDRVLEAAEQRTIVTAVGGSGGLDNERPFSGIFGALGCTEHADDPRRVAVWRMVADATMGTLWDREGAIARFAVSDALVDLVEQELSRFPLLLMVDDLHWTDSASLHAIAALAPLCSRSPLLIVAAYRPGPSSDGLDRLLAALAPIAMTLRLGPLDAADSAALMHRALGDSNRSLPVLMDALGGNPFLLVAAARAARGGDGMHSAEIIRWVVLSHLDGLSPSTTECLRIAAALGGRFEAADVAVVLGRAEVEVIGELGDAVRAGVLVGDGRALRFVHDIVRETMLAELDEALLIGLHGAIWRALAAAGRPASMYSGHAIRAASVGDTEAIEVLRRAAAEMAETDPDRASVVLAHAAELAVPLGWRARGAIATQRAEMLRLASRPAEVVAVVEECADWPLPPDQLALLEYVGAGALRFLGRVADSIAMLRQSISRDALPPAMTSWAWSMIVATEVFSLATGDEVDDAVVEARSIAEREGDRVARVQADCAASSVAWIRGRVGEALAFARSAAERAAPLGHAVWPAPALFSALAMLTDGDPDAAIATITPWGRRAEQAGDLWALSRMEMVTAWAQFDAGDWDNVTAHCETIVRIGIETGGANGQPLAQAMAGLVACRRGDLETARAMSAEGQHVLSTPCVDPPGVPFLAWLDAELAEAAGDDAGGRATLDATFDMVAAVGPIGMIWLAPSVSRRAIEAGDSERVRAVADRLEATLIGSERGDHLIRLCRAMAEGDTESIATLAAHPMAAKFPAMARDAWLAAAALHRASGRADEERACLDEVRRIEAVLGMVPGPKAGKPPMSRLRATAAPHERLTPAETNVLRIVADGLTNAAIAERLYLSKRTVESHVSRMYVKLGVSTRVELARVYLDQSG